MQGARDAKGDVTVRGTPCCPLLQDWLTIMDCAVHLDVVFRVTAPCAELGKLLREQGENVGLLDAVVQVEVVADLLGFAEEAGEGFERLLPSSVGELGERAKRARRAAK